MLPNFFIVGAPKCGTTSLNEYLDQHPQIYMSKMKEPYFFMNFKCVEKDQYEQIVDVNDTKVLSYGDYTDLFKEAQNEKVIGEATPLYLYSDLAIENIKKAIEKPKFLIMLRHPVERMFSSFLHFKRDGKIPDISFEGFLEDTAANCKEFKDTAITQSLYFNHVKKYIDNFGKESVYVISLESFVKDKADEYKKISIFLGVNEEYLPDFQMTYNQSGVPKNIKLYLALNDLNLGITKFMPKSVYKSSVFAKFRSVIRDSLMKEKPKLNPSLKESLYDRLFLDDVNKLSEALGVIFPWQVEEDLRYNLVREKNHC